MHRLNKKMAKRKKIESDVSTEEKIKLAARKLFTERGFDAVKTRDIAAEAGINLALLNYYFRGKKKLYDIIMLENFQQFIQGLMPVIGDENMPVQEIIAKTAGIYIDMLISNPDLPNFVMNAAKGEERAENIMKHDSVMVEKMKKLRAGFMKRVEKSMKDGELTEVHLVHFMMNFMGLVIFPFVARPILVRLNRLNDKQFNELMEERKKLVPLWLKTIMKTKI